MRDKAKMTSGKTNFSGKKDASGAVFGRREM